MADSRCSATNDFGRIERRPSWAKLRTCKLQESRTIKVGIQDIRVEVDARFNELQNAQKMVIEDPEILSGTPVIRGTRIPVYDVSSLVDQKTPMNELKEVYPRLSEEQFRFVSFRSLHAAAFANGHDQAHHGAILTQAAALADSVKLTPILCPQRFTPTELDAAYSLVERSLPGKVVVEFPD